LEALSFELIVVHSGLPLQENKIVVYVTKRSGSLWPQAQYVRCTTYDVCGKIQGQQPSKQRKEIFAY